MKRRARLGILVPVTVMLLAGCTLLPAPEYSPAKVDGNPVLTVTQALEARENGATGPIAIGGWFSMAPVHSCPAPMRDPHPFEFYCQAGDWALAEAPEAIVDVVILQNADSTSMTVAGRSMTSARLQPVLELGQGQIFPPGTTETWRPVPVVLIGHFGDPRAATCPAELRRSCFDRFVAERVVRP
jgi:hypothetical protein